ncbi:MAG: peptide/nickel transport system substrate-binding protein [Chloroflexota bacterium]|nr:peptide/nickel transport system substrate-binding protein [Chloroflexota bacterium]
MKAKYLLIVALFVVVSCARSEPAVDQAGSRSNEAAPRADRTLVLIAHGQPETLADKVPLKTTGLRLTTTPRVFNAGLALIDAGDAAHPYLVDALPQLGTNDWQVFPDGRMETRYHLRANLTWHDGAPLTADDFAFAYRIYSQPQFGHAALPPLKQIDDVVAIDERTLVIRWNEPFANAARIDSEDFPPLPRHLLDAAFRADAPEAFVHEPFWSTAYIAAGPYMLERWEPGAFIEARAFPGHALGAPKIGRLRIQISGDPNSAMATLLAGDAHMAVDGALGFQQGAVLRRQWVADGRGVIISIPDGWRRVDVQLRPDYVGPRALLDVNVRRAFAHAVDRQGLIDSLYEGEALLADSFIPPQVDFYPGVDQALAKYPFDRRRTDQLMTDAGYRRGADGVFTGTAGRFAVELKTNADSESLSEMSVLAAGWRQAGFDVQEVPVPPELARSGEVRGSFPGLYVGGGFVGEDALSGFTSTRIGMPENRWVGGNRSGWASSGTTARSTSSMAAWTETSGIGR